MILWLAKQLIPNAGEANRSVGAGLTSWLALALLAAQVPTRAALVSAGGPPALGSRPLSFEPDADSIRFLARGPDYQFQVAPNELRLALFKPHSPPRAFVPGRQNLIIGRSASFTGIRVEFLNANVVAKMRGENELRGKVNYLIGNDASRWRTGVPTYGKVRIEGLYPGIGLVYYGNQQQLEYDFEIAPAADPAAIAMRFVGVDQLALNDQGELVLKVGGDEIHEPRPAVYQMQGRKRVPVQGGYRLDPNQTVKFELGPYDHQLPLVIDPRFEYSTYFGGNGGDLGLEIKVDLNGNVYITGETLSTEFPFPVSGNVLQPVLGGGSSTGDAFVAKLDSTGTNLIYLTYLGGAADDGGLDLAIDTMGNAYVDGFTQSSNFPVKSAIFPNISGTADSTFGVYPADGFVAELNTNGSALVFSTYLGGSASDIADGIAVDPGGNVYVTGITFSTDFPLTNQLAILPTFGIAISHAFVCKFSPQATSLIFSTYLGGLAVDEGQGIAADTNGFAYVTGFTASTNFPITTNASQPLINLTNELSSFDAFLTKFTPAGSLVFSTYLGGTYNDYGYRVTLDAAGNAYVTGPAQSLDFPNTVTNVPGLVRTTPATNPIVNYDVFLTKFDPNGQRIYSTIFGGTNDDVGWDVAVDAQGNAFIVGNTFSTDFPTTNVFDLLSATNSGGHDVFVTAINSNASALFYSGYLGGSTNDFGYGIAVDAESSAYLVGNTFSTNFPTTAAPLQSSLDGTSDAFVAKLRLKDPVLTATLTNRGLQLQWPSTAPRYTLESTLSLTPPAVWTPIGISPILSQGWYLLDLGTTNAETLFRLRSQ